MYEIDQNLGKILPEIEARKLVDELNSKPKWINCDDMTKFYAQYANLYNLTEHFGDGEMMMKIGLWHVKHRCSLHHTPCSWLYMGEDYFHGCNDCNFALAHIVEGVVAKNIGAIL